MPVDWLFCNICIRFNTDKGALPFHVTSCGHVACNTCVEKGRMDTRACGVCKKPTTVKPIDQLKGVSQLMFEDPAATAKKFIAEATKVTKFQATNRQALKEHMKKENIARERAIREAKEDEDKRKMELSQARASTNTSTLTRPSQKNGVLAYASVPQPSSVFSQNTPQSSNRALPRRLIETPQSHNRSSSTLDSSRMITPINTRSFMQPLSSGLSARSELGDLRRRDARDPILHRVTRTITAPTRLTKPYKMMRSPQREQRFC